MKVTLSPKQISQVTELRDQLVAILKKRSKNSSEFDRLTKKRDEIEQQIADLEQSDSEADASKLAAKRTQLGVVLKKIEAMESQPAEQTNAIDSKAKDLLMEFRRVLVAVASPEIEKYRHTLAAKVREFCQSDEEAYHAVFQMPSLGSLQRVCLNDAVSVMYSTTTPDLKRAIHRATELLAGEIAWSWDPKIKA